MEFDSSFLIRRDELTLRHRYASGRRRLAFDQSALEFADWRDEAAGTLRRLLGVNAVGAGAVRTLRSAVHAGVRVEALVMRVDGTLSLPAYMLHPVGAARADAVLAIHGHGEVEACVAPPAMDTDYHHRFAWHLARAGHAVLCPGLRGFGNLRDLAYELEGASLEYWQRGDHMVYTLVTDGFQHGRTLLGETVEDLLRWEEWLAADRGVRQVDVAGISYGGDLALTYPAFSTRVRRIFASGTLGSFEPIFSEGRNAPAHCVPGVLDWLDRADIAGINAPRPLMLHYGALDVPGPRNNSASYNETVPESIAALRRIYAAAGAPDAVSVHVTPARGHEMDVDALTTFLR